MISQPLLNSIGINVPLVESAIAIAILYYLLTLTSSELFWSGFFGGILLFYWVSFSFYYFDMPYLIPFVILAIGFLYGVLFLFFAYLSSLLKQYKLYARAFLLIFYFDILTLFGFNWFKPELFLSNTYFGVNKLCLAILLAAIALTLSIKSRLRFIFACIALFALSVEDPIPLPNIKIFLANTYTNFESKYEGKNILNNFDIIQKATNEGYDMVVLPETAFAYPINRSEKLMNTLNQKSKQITILCGSLKIDEKNMYNSNYLFSDGKMYIFDKVIGVPFGEVNPMPKFMSDFVNKIFFNGADDFKTADNFSDFTIKNTKFRNAICYEATKDEAYDGNPKFMIALSNNAWFMPSIEPYIQKKLIKFYSRKNKTVVFHAVNMSESYVVN